MRRHPSTRITVTLLASAGPPGASAHAMLKHASPAVGSRGAAAPAELGRDFPEGVEPAFGPVTVQDAAGARVDRGDLHGAATHLAIGVQPLPPGAHTVIWDAVSVDTHRTGGRFRFTVAP